LQSAFHNYSKPHLKTSQTHSAGSSHSPVSIIYIHNLIFFSFVAKKLCSPDRRPEFYITNGYQDENGSADGPKINELPIEWRLFLTIE